MAGRKRTLRPTDAELAILRVLWHRGPATVRQVYDAMGQPSGYTTTLKMLQIMTAKGLVLRDESARTHVYRPAAGRARTQRLLIRDLLDRVFEGSAAALVVSALATRRTSARELKQIRTLLNGYTQKEGGS